MIKQKKSDLKSLNFPSLREVGFFNKHRGDLMTVRSFNRACELTKSNPSLRGFSQVAGDEAILKMALRYMAYRSLRSLAMTR
ncbi:hypothetical protein [Sphingobacterium yanglingense]|uniref:Uncharacterized protein n=1 Tax=Sphingobacterium yanglingense TaxID=1437280 RepID=A0A4R6WJB2_9SPHI|nr:hypothetical protein [Sphingobacterium yanglingense]TDQ77820.1 hypothetical protein CLV99_1785 [Sphingobacterium yanglingense]